MEGGYSDVVVDEMADDDDSTEVTSNREDTNDQFQQSSSDYDSNEESELLVYTCATAPEEYRAGTPIPGVDDEEVQGTPQRTDYNDEKEDSVVSATPPTSTPSTPTTMADKNSVRPTTFKNILQAKKRLQAFSSAKVLLKKEETKFEVKEEEEQEPSPVMVECKEEKNTTPKKSKKDKEMDPNERAKAVIEEIEALKREEAKQRGPPKGLKSPDREEFRRRDLKGRRFRRKSRSSPIPQSSINRKSPPPPPREYRKFDIDSRDRSSLPNTKISYSTAKSWKEYKKLPDFEQTGTDCKFDPQIYRALNQNCFLKRLLSVETPNMMLKSLMVNRQSKKESYFVPFHQVRNTKTVPHICWSANPEISLPLTRKEVFDYVSSQRRELIEKVYNQDRKKYPTVKRLTNRSWYPKHWSKIDRSEFAVIQTYSDNDIELSDKEINSFESNKNSSNEIKDKSFNENKHKIISDNKSRERKKKSLEKECESRSADFEEKEGTKKSKKSLDFADRNLKNDKKCIELEDKNESQKSNDSKNECKLELPPTNSESFKFYQSIKELEEELERRKRMLQLQHTPANVEKITTSIDKEEKSKNKKGKKNKNKRKKKHSSTSTSSSSSESSEAEEKPRKKKKSESKHSGSTDRSSRSKSADNKLDKEQVKDKKVKNLQSSRKKRNEKEKKSSRKTKEKKKNSKKSNRKKNVKKEDNEKSPDTDEYHSHWESEDDVPALIPDKNTSWESEEEEVFNRHMPNVPGSTPKTEYESKDFEIPLNIKFVPRTDEKAAPEKSVDTESELHLLKIENEKLAEQRRLLEMEKLRVRDMQKNKVLMSEKELRKRKKKIKKKLLSNIDWMDADSLALAKANIKKEIFDTDLDGSFMDKEKSAILENEYKEFMKSVTSGLNAKKDRKKKKKRKGRNSSTSSSSSDSSSDNSIKHTRKRKKKKSNLAHSSPKVPNLVMSKMVITSLDDLLPACFDADNNQKEMKEKEKAQIDDEPFKELPTVEDNVKIDDLGPNEATTTITEAPSLESIPLPIPTPVPPPKIDMPINPLITSTLSLDLSLPNLDPKLPIIESKLSIPEVKIPLPEPIVKNTTGPINNQISEPESNLIMQPKIDEEKNFDDHLPSIDDVLLEDTNDIHLKENIDESVTNIEPIIFTSMVLPVKKTLLDNSALKLNDSDGEEKTDEKIKKSSEEKVQKDLNTSKDMKKDSSKKETKKSEESKKRDDDRHHNESRKSDESKKSDDAKRKTDLKKSSGEDSRRSDSKDSKREKSRRSPVSSARRKRSPVRRRNSPKSRRNQSPAARRRSSISPKRSRRSPPHRYRGRRSISPRRRSKRSFSPPSPSSRGPRSPPPIKRHRSRSPRRDKSPEMKKSLADSTISDDLLPLQTGDEIDRFKTESPKRPSLDERINQVLGISNSEEYAQGSSSACNYYSQQSQQSYSSYSNYPANYSASPNKNVVQMGNMLQIVPTEDFSTTQLESKVNSVIDAAGGNTTQKIVQFGNMLQIVPAQMIEGTIADVGNNVQVIACNDNSTASAESLMQQKIAERKAERDKRRQEREQRRKEKERRRKEREIKRQLKVKMKTESLIKKMAFEMDEENGFVNEEVEDEENEWPLLLDPLQIISNPIKDGLKSILAKGGFNKTESRTEEVAKKSVLFADGIRPGEGTSPSGGEELSSPPPIAPKVKRYKKVKVPRKAKKKKIRVKVVKKQLAEDESNEEDNLPPPPPPPGSPPPHLFPPRIKTHTINNIHPNFMHNNMVPPPVPAPVPVPPPNPNNYQQYVQPPPPPTRMLHHNRSGPPPPPIPMPATPPIHYQQSPNLH